MFHKVVSVPINRSAHEIFKKIFLFIEIFNAPGSVHAPRSGERLSRAASKLKYFCKS